MGGVGLGGRGWGCAGLGWVGLDWYIPSDLTPQIVKKRNQKELDPHNQKKGPEDKSRNQIRKAKAKLKT